MQERSAEILTKHASQSSGHFSDDNHSPASSTSCNRDGSDDLDSESDITDSGYVVDLPRADKSCFSTGKDKNGTKTDSISPKGDLVGDKAIDRKVHRFKVSFVDEAALSAASE